MFKCVGLKFVDCWEQSFRGNSGGRTHNLAGGNEERTKIKEYPVPKKNLTWGKIVGGLGGTILSPKEVVSSGRTGPLPSQVRLSNMVMKRRGVPRMCRLTMLKWKPP